MATVTVMAIQSTVPVIESAASPGIAAVTQVNEGSTVNAMYLRVEVIATGNFSGVPRIYMAVFKRVGGVGPTPDANAVGGDELKKRIIHQEMIMLQDNVDLSLFPRTLFQGVVKIPRSLRRMGYNDKFEILLQNGTGETTAVVNACVQCIYKEYQ